MKTRAIVTVVVSILIAVSWVGAEEIAGLPLHVQKIDDGVIRLWVGDHTSSTSIMAFATEKGIVVVDTFGVPEIDTGLRQAIAHELGRSDFAYLINTHEHSDHTGGNSVYNDCTIVGHELVAPGISAFAERRDFRINWYTDRIAEIGDELETLAGDDPEVAAISEDLILTRLNLEVDQAAVQPALPSLTFSDRMTLSLGDTTFELFYIGGMHTASDIAVFVPEHGILLTGDTMADVWLTDTPGCLASFSVRDGMPHDFPRWLANWDYILAQRDQITTVLPAHWNGELSIEGAEARVEYVRALWDGITEAASDGKSIIDVQTEFRLDTRFPDLVGSPGFDQQRNNASITELWRVITNQASAARLIFTLLSEDAADETAIAEVLADRDSASPGSFFSEAEFNAYGYALLQQDKLDEAITIFRINTELFPESWNVYDSLGEALLRAGRTEDAAAMYEKSLALNPESPTGQEALKNIRDGAAAM
jgi:glyoxylase-like metal-dependent hydrolase (beta-lactamase superfamily II)